MSNTDTWQRRSSETRRRNAQSRREHRRHFWNAARHQEVRVNTAYPQGTSFRRPPPSVLESRQYAGIPRMENYRSYWGRSLDLVRIEQAIKGAHVGMMRNMTDMGRETLMLDGHASSCLQKRLNRVAALPLRLDAAKGAGVDKELAEEYRREVELQLSQIPGFKRALRQLAWAVYDGRASLEIEWHFDPRQAFPWRVKRLHWIHPRRLGFGTQRQLQIVESNREYSDFVDAGLQLDSVPLKFIQYRPQLFADYPEREGLCPRILYWSFFSRFGVRERMALLEIFGKPWRIAYADNPENVPNDEDYEAAEEIVDALGATTTAVMPRGFKLDVTSPTQNAGQVHADSIEHGQLIVSKLVLGNTSTTDAQPSGLNSNQSDVHKSEEDLIVEADAEDLAEALEDGLTDAIVVANRGPMQVINAPRVVIAPEERSDPEKELKNAQAAVTIGVPVALAEVRERSGYRQVAPDEPYLQLVSRPASLGAPAPPPQVEVVWPEGKAPKVGELAPAPSEPLDPLEEDSADLPTGPGSQPPAQPGGEIGLSGDESLDERRELARKMTDGSVTHCEHGRSNRCTICGIERVRDVELDQDGKPVWAVNWRAIGDREPKDEAPLGDPGESGAVPVNIAAKLNSTGSAHCEHGSRRKCLECGVVKSRQGAPWRMLGFDESKVKREGDGRFGEKPDEEKPKSDTEDGQPKGPKGPEPERSEAEVETRAARVAAKRKELRTEARSVAREERALEKSVEDGSAEVHDFETVDAARTIADVGPLHPQDIDDRLREEGGKNPVTRIDPEVAVDRGIRVAVHGTLEGAEADKRPLDEVLEEATSRGLADAGYSEAEAEEVRGLRRKYFEGYQQALRSGAAARNRQADIIDAAIDADGDGRTGQAEEADDKKPAG